MFPWIFSLLAIPTHCLSIAQQVDTFLRENLDWMGRASNWAKFTATASIGVVHRGHMKESMSLLQPYLPQGGVSALPFSEGGALYALGLIHSNKGSDGNAEVRGRYFVVLCVSASGWGSSVQCLFGCCAVCLDRCLL